MNLRKPKKTKHKNTKHKTWHVPVGKKYKHERGSVKKKRKRKRDRDRENPFPQEMKIMSMSKQEMRIMGRGDKGPFF